MPQTQSKSNCSFDTQKTGGTYRHVCRVCGAVRVTNKPAHTKACHGPGTGTVRAPSVHAPPGRIGKCHICKEQKTITFCKFCGHWMCSACRKDWAQRGLAALKAWLGGKQAGCCGPDSRE